MLNNNFNNTQQKSPKRRFLLILGGLLFVSIVVLGLMIIFWKKFPIPLTAYYRYAFGTLCILYGILRFVHIVKRANDEQI